MKRTILIIVTLSLLLMGVIGSAFAAGKYSSLEELLQTEGPAIVRVIAKTDEPTNMHMKETLTAKTTWRWLVQDQSGSFRPSSLYVDMDQYQRMTVGDRSFILNHKECALTIDISASGVFKVTAITGASRPISSSDIGSIALAALGMCAVAILIYFLVSRVILASPTQANMSTQGWRPSKLFTFLAFLGMLSEDKDRHRDRH